MKVNETKRYEELSQLGKSDQPDQKTRGEMAILQNKFFTQIECDDPEIYEGKVEKLISKWIKQHENCISVSEPVPVDLEKFYSDVRVHNRGQDTSNISTERHAKDDLFGKLEITTGTENVILRAEFSNELIDFYNDYLSTYLKWGWVIPIKNKIDGEDGETVTSLEKSLGDYLIANDVPILNFYSHRL